MRNPLLFLVVNDYITKLISRGAFKNIEVNIEEPNKGFIYYNVNKSTNKIPPISSPEEVINNTAAGLLILEGYVVVNCLDNTFVVSNDKGDIYFISDNSCSCADRYSPCKHMLFVRWYESFRKRQVSLIHTTKN